MTPADRLRALLARPGLLVMPGCHDAMSARLVHEAGFELGFMSGFAVSADRLAMPDTGLISYGELVEQGQNICRAAPQVPFIGDGDTGFGSAQNIKRTVEGYFRAGFAGIGRRFIDVDTPGLATQVLSRLPYTRIRRPVFPLDDI